MNMTTTNTDPLCFYCGRPIVGSMVWGNAGPYHPECTRPPTATASTSIWKIRHPGTGDVILLATFEEALEWFEGWNVPWKVTNGQDEPFSESHARMMKTISDRTRPDNLFAP